MAVTDRIKERARHIQRYYHADGPMPYKYLITPEHLARAQLLQPKFRFDDFPDDAEEFPPSWQDASGRSGKNSLSAVLHSPAWTTLPTQSQPASGQATEIKAEAPSKSDGAGHDEVSQATAQLSLEEATDQIDDGQSAISLLKGPIDRSPAQTPWTDHQAESSPCHAQNFSEQSIPDFEAWGSRRRLSDPWSPADQGSGDGGDDDIEIFPAPHIVKAPTYSPDNGESSMAQHRATKHNSSCATSVLKRLIADTLQVHASAAPKKLDRHQVGQSSSGSFLAPDVHVPSDSPFAMRGQSGPAGSPGVPNKDGSKKEFKYSKEQVAKYVKWCKKQQKKKFGDKEDLHMDGKSHDGKGKGKEV
ncbi:hypothetical protein CEP54_014805 [Fusarium duplospermum]|uniref:Uncharacterized protein n=1 Tax=Fusarium duplospermum TaxID=1325734 RepID=A0A428NTM4_9HYPO|nr:hypothetical protein CEP54_014805 [Fusarium duplospermum]